MKNLIKTTLTAVICLNLIAGCSGKANPVSPQPANSLTSQVENPPGSQTHLWAYCTVFIDIENHKVTVIDNRQALFTVNVTNFLNGKPASMEFKINEVITGADYVDIDIDVSVTHPFPGLPQYHGYDVRGVFMGNGSATLKTSGVKYPVLGMDQFMMDDPDASGGDLPGGGADGYTRWFNITEFSTGGMPLFQYTQGKLASKGFNGTATICPYRYFADNLEPNEDAWTWLINNSHTNGRFSSGAKNTRNYYLRFPNSTSVVYGYAVIADWSGVEPKFHPSNAVEAIACKVTDNSNVYFIDASNFGGKINLDFSLWGWSGQPSAIYIESTVLSNPYKLSSSEMVPIGGTENYSTWHVEIPADNVKGKTGNEYWIIPEYNDDYSNDFGVSNLAENEPLRAYFRYGLAVGDETPAWLTIITPNGGEVMEPEDNYEIKWTSAGLSGNVLIEYSKDNFVSDIWTIAASEPNDGSCMWTVPCDPSDTVRVRVSSISMPSVKDTSDGNFIIEGSGWAQSWGEKPSGGYCGGSGIAVDDSGFVYIAGKYNGATDFDPGPPVDLRPTAGGYDLFLSKYSLCGKYIWTKTWGGTEWESCYSVAVDSENNVYVCGYFPGTVDFDPDPGNTVNKTSNGDGDAFIVKFTPNGNFVWVRTWGGSGFDAAYSVICDLSGNVYATGWFLGTVNFNGSGGSDTKASNGMWDCYLTKYDTSGNYKWAKTWGSSASSYDWGTGVDVDSSGNIYCTGWFSGTTDFDPGPGDESYTAPVNPGLYITKFDSSGNHDWARTWGCGNSNNWDFGPDVCVRGSDVAVTARYTGTVDFDPGTGPGEELIYTSIGACDICVSKFDTSGNFKWARVWGSTNDEVGRGVAIDSSGNVYVGAEFLGTIDFNPGPGTEFRTSVGNRDLSLSKFDASGNFLWVRTFGGSGNDRPALVALDKSNNSYMTGYIQGFNINFAPSYPPCNAPADLHSSHGECDAFVVKHFPDGCWEK